MTETRMRREIAECPEVAARLLAPEASRRAEALALRLREHRPRLLATIARGSSDKAAEFLAYAAAIGYGLPAASLPPSLASVYESRLRLEGVLALAVSQSGRSPDIVAMQAAARRGGALTVALVNMADSPLEEASEESLPLCAGPEEAVAATKSLVAAIVAGLQLLALWHEDGPLLESLSRLPEILARALKLDWSPLAEQLAARPERLFILGRGPTSPLAAEAALKCKEILGLHAEALSGAEFLHGPVAALAPDSLVLVLAADDEAGPGQAALAGRLASTCRVLAAVPDSLPLENGALRLSVGAAGTSAQPPHPFLSALSLMLPFYAAAEAAAAALGLNPDAPPGLSKITRTI